MKSDIRNAYADENAVLCVHVQEQHFKLKGVINIQAIW